MKTSVGFAKPCTIPPTRDMTLECCILIQPIKLNGKFIQNQPLKIWQGLLDPVRNDSTASGRPVKLGRRWMEYQGIRNWEGLLDPLDDNLRREILRYGDFVDAAYKSFDCNPSSPTYATCRFPKSNMFKRSGLSDTGYRVTKHLRATSGIQFPPWMEKASSWMFTQSSWIGYVAVSQNKAEIGRLGRRDVVITFRGTLTCLEWLETLRATLTQLPNTDCDRNGSDESGPMVQTGFLSLYTSGTPMGPSLKEMVREEIKRLLRTYGDHEVPLSLTLTGHSLGAALATLAAHDIKTTFNRVPLVTVISFGGPRVGNQSFRQHLEKQGTKILRIVNSEDVITKVPGFVIDEDQNHVGNKRDLDMASFPSLIQKFVEDTQWVYAEVGRELRLSSKDSPYLNSIDVATCHDLKTYLHLVKGFVSSSYPFRAKPKRFVGNHRG